MAENRRRVLSHHFGELLLNPDGSPCGLLNHLTAACRILTHCVSTKKLPAVLNRLGLLSHGEVDLFTSDDGELYPVVLDSEFIGYLPTPIALRVERQENGKDNTAIEHFGEALSKAGFDHLGTETLYSGVDGREMEVQIFTGLVYYQRLRHMIEDKFQVRSTGLVDPVTLQPVKGRKKQGGVRFGEMERDALISHGANFCLRDRLLICSDQDSVFVCANCESIVSVTKLRPKPTAMRQNTPRLSMPGSGGKNEENYQKFATRRHCSICGSDQHVHVPRILRYLAAELSSVNVKLQMHITHPAILER